MLCTLVLTMSARRMGKLLTIIISLVLTQPIQSQINQAFTESEDSITSTYYTNLNNQFILRLYTMYKSNNVNILKTNNELRYRPNGTMNLGIGFNYKFLGLGISYGIPPSESSRDKYGSTQRLDIQLSLFSQALGADGFLQYYKGYYIQNPGDFVQWDNQKKPKMPDMTVLTLGVNAFYILNHKKFSYRAAFIGNQIQTKSAGSITAGLFGTYDRVNTDNGFVPKELSDSTNIEFDLKSFGAYTIGLTVGYMHTFVLDKGFFISLAAVPGIGYRKYRVVDINDHDENKEQLAIQLLGRIALGYYKERFFVNLNTLFNVRNYNYKSYEFSLSTEQLRLTLGMRFITKASKKRNQFYPE